MSAHAPIRHWYLNSGIIECGTCEGKGSYWNGQGNGSTDPDSWDIECPDCDQLGHHACEVCGFDVVVPGMDCLACDMARELPAKLLTDEVAEKLAAAVKASIKVAHVHAAQVAAETVEDDRREKARSFEVAAQSYRRDARELELRAAEKYDAFISFDMLADRFASALAEAKAVQS